MEVKLRLDNNGQPYLVITHVDVDPNGSTVEQDAERLFFGQLSQNGASLHVMGSAKKGETKLLVISNSEKRGFFRLSEQNMRSSSVVHEQIVPQPPMHARREDPGLVGQGGPAGGEGPVVQE